MKEAEFKAWLSQRRYQGQPLKTVGNRIGWTKAVERALSELGFTQTTLDDVHSAGEWDALLQTMSALRSDWHKNEAAAQRIAPQSADPHLQVANARQAIGMYGRFLDGDDPNYDSGADEGNAMTDEQILARFTQKAEFAEWWKSWPQADRDAFLRTVRLTHEAGLDWYHLKMTHEVRCGRKKIGAIDATEVYVQISGKAPYAHVRKAHDRDALDLSGDWISLLALAEALNAAPQVLGRFDISRDGYWPDEVNPDLPQRPEIDVLDPGSSNEPTNLIFYGPPGTGKTYATAVEAVRLCGEPVPEDRSTLMAQYGALVAERRIAFVTFHQSFSYEDFVEGLRPVVPKADGEASTAGFNLQAEPGIFRQMAERAQTARGRSEQMFDLTDRPVYKMSLGEVADSASDFVFEDAVSEGYALLGFNDIDWSDPRFEEREEIFEAVRKQFPEQDLTPNKGVVRSPDVFRNQLQVGDVLVAAKGNHRFRAIGVVEGEYEYAPRPDGRYCHRRKVRWLWSDPTGRDVADIYPPRFIQSTIYKLKDAELDRPALSELVAGASQDVGTTEPLPHVLIVDEINRANISKVFGELITLLEPDKRIGMPNALTVRLPYSKREFGVPANLHIVGTMNTADRSIALLDTALRRRFRFRELAPDTKVPAFQDAVRATGLPLDAVLEAINERIEYLIDREHRIGHAFFIGCRSRTDVDAAMRDKIIPLLQEYFFEDWSRVAAVLGERRDTGGAFLDGRKLRDPTGNDGQDRVSWSVRTEFAPDAYERLIGKVPPQEPSLGVPA